MTTDRSRAGKKARNKGQGFMRQIARWVRHQWPKAAPREQYRGGHHNCDVEGTPYWIECKREAKVPTEYRLNKWLEKAVSDRDMSGDQRSVVLIVRPDRHPIIYRAVNGAVSGMGELMSVIDEGIKLDRQRKEEGDK